jgi:hypothetical protein
MSCFSAFTSHPQEPNRLSLPVRSPTPFLIIPSPWQEIGFSKRSLNPLERLAEPIRHVLRALNPSGKLWVHWF